MRTPYVARYTSLHCKLWGPYRIIAYPRGFHDWPPEEAAPVWIPEARIINARGAAIRGLGDCATLDEAIEVCWMHLASLG